jgi:ATP-binding cassette, subfamily B (MDR/TAP), member 1
VGVATRAAAHARLRGLRAAGVAVAVRGRAGVGAREGEGAGAGEEEGEDDEVEPPPAAVSFWKLFEFADGLDCALMAAGALAAAAHGVALVVYLHYFGRALNLLDSERIGSALHGRSDELLHRFKGVSWC